MCFPDYKTHRKSLFFFRCEWTISEYFVDIQSVDSRGKGNQIPKRK